MAKITYGKHEVDVQPDESLLQALLKADIAVPYSCGSGICQCCKLQCTQGQLPPESQNGLAGHETAQNMFLACQCYPTSDLDVNLVDQSQIRVPAKIVKKEHASDLITRIWLAPEKRLSYTSGQFIGLWKDDTHCRSYSLASVPRLDQHLEFHIQRHAKGQFSRWLCDKAKKGTKVYLDPISQGSCTYYSALPNFPITLIGRHSGLAPLYGIVREALFLEHPKPIHLVYVAADDTGCYLDDTLLELEAKHPNFTYSVLLENVSTHAQLQFHWRIGQSIKDVLKTDEHFKKSTVFICGNECFVTETNKFSYLSGVKPNHIYSDSFVTASTI